MPNSTEQSKAHRLFFAKATHRGVFDLQYSDYWDVKLRESGADVLRRFIAEGLISPAPIKDVIDKRFTVEQLKPHMKERGLKVSGKKFELLERIIAADPEWAQEQTKDGALYFRTREGSLLADEIYTSIGTDSGEMEARIIGLIHDEKYEEAFRIWAEWDEDQVFPRDEWQGIDNRQTNSNTFVQMARSIAAKMPAGDRERAIMNVLYGKASYEPQELEVRHGSTYERDLMQWRETGFVIGMQIKPSHNIHNPDFECSSAKKYAGYFRLEDAPDYPFGECAYEKDESFCNCWWSPIFEGEQPKGEWKIPQKRHPMAGPPAKRKTIQPITKRNDCAPEMMLDISHEVVEKGAGIFIQTTIADSTPDTPIGLSQVFSKRVMDNKTFSVAFAVVLLLAILFVL